MKVRTNHDPLGGLPHAVSQYLYLLVKVRTKKKTVTLTEGNSFVAIPIPSGEGQNEHVGKLRWKTNKVAIPIPSGEGQNGIALARLAFAKRERSLSQYLYLLVKVRTQGNVLQRYGLVTCRNTYTFW